MPVAFYYAAAFGAALGTAFFFTPLALRIATKKQILDHPGDYKTQRSAVPYLGGVAIVLAFAVVVLIGAFLRPLATFASEVPIIIGIAVALSLMGLIDDLRGINPFVRFAIEIAGAVILFYVGVGVELFPTVQPLNVLFSVFWIVGITNAFNLLDNMDGLSAGVAVIASMLFFILGAVNGQILVATLAVALAGCALGFLRHNFHPAKIYMGDAGSLFLGFMLSVIGLKLRFPSPAQITFLVPILVLWVPIFDTVLVVTTRLAHRLNPFAGGRDHTSHRLVFVGIPVPTAVNLIYLSTAALGWLAICVSRVDVTTGYMLGGLVGVTSLVLGGLLARVPVYESSQRRRMMLVEVSRHPHDPEDEADEADEAEVAT